MTTQPGALAAGPCIGQALLAFQHPPLFGVCWFPDTELPEMVPLSTASPVPNLIKAPLIRRELKPPAGRFPPDPMKRGAR